MTPQLISYIHLDAQCERHSQTETQPEIVVCLLVCSFNISYSSIFPLLSPFLWQLWCWEAFGAGFKDKHFTGDGSMPQQSLCFWPL